MSTATAARDTVLATPELLALLLAQLPLRALLLRAPLVCEMWLATTLSPALQRAPFLAPALFPPFFAPSPPPSRYTWPTAHVLMAMPAASVPVAFARADASWRRMLVAQPPVRVVQRAHARGGDFSRSAEVRFRGGGQGDGGELRMGALYDLAAGRVKRAGSAFCVAWHEGVRREVDLTLETADVMQFVDGRAGPLSGEFCGHGEGPRGRGLSSGSGCAC
ncbi:hypothetical protein B0H15DRAFT_806913 [Mycena belliarum]|uniref:Uncharacterized protein n=1 Tax=Mycena belliarum TaxID=1033014 RepID=A0AAD6XEC0_9AGAR|nr:hypothetical protein B0H15DRAFT_806913 [Mycena belliae]